MLDLTAVHLIPGWAAVRHVSTYEGECVTLEDTGMWGDCAESPWLFDDHLDLVTETAKERSQRHQIARRICLGCPLLAACERQLRGQTEPASGVWAGELVGHPDRLRLNEQYRQRERHRSRRRRAKT
jgi:hypothetical protein